MGRRGDRMHVRKDDVVEVTSGAERGKSGKVLSVNLATRRVFIEGLNLVKKNIKRNQDYPQGGIIEKEASIHVSNLKVVERAGSI